MKQLAVALTVAVLSSSAVAQNIGIYGRIDTGFQSYDNGSQSVTRGQDSNLSTSVLGFRGSEDLGGGITANFQLEGLLAPSTGTLGSTTANQLFNREAWVGFSGAFGEIRTGRTDVTPTTDIDTFTSQVNNLGNQGVNTTAIELGADQPNVVRWISPKLGGLQIQVGHATGNDATATTDGNVSQTGVYAQFEAGKLTVYAGQHESDGTSTDAKRDFVAYGAKYDFGFMSVGASHAQGDVSTTGDLTQKGTTASVAVPVGSGVTLHGVYLLTEDATQASDNEGKGYVVAVTKSLSSRTRLYLAHTTIDNEANSSMRGGGTSAPAAAGVDTKATIVGISHSF